MNAELDIKRIGLVVRKIVEKMNQKYGNPWDENLGGACGFASLGLNKAIPGSVFVAGFYGEDALNQTGHCWIELEDYIVDITATQFGLEDRVYITHKNNPYYVEEEKGRKAVKIARDWLFPSYTDSTGGIEREYIKAIKTELKRKKLI